MRWESARSGWRYIFLRLQDSHIGSRKSEKKMELFSSKIRSLLRVRVSRRHLVHTAKRKTFFSLSVVQISEILSNIWLPSSESESKQWLASELRRNSLLTLQNRRISLILRWIPWWMLWIGSMLNEKKIMYSWYLPDVRVLDSFEIIWIVRISFVRLFRDYSELYIICVHLYSKKS